MERVAVCPGSFDPVTVGHIDIIKRARQMFDKVIVATMDNNEKDCFFSYEQRVDMIRRSLEHEGLCDIEVEAVDGLLAEYTRKKGAVAIVKGLRAVSDFEYEFQMALINKKINPLAETVFLTTSLENMYLSSSVVRSIASVGGDISSFVPAPVHGDVQKRFENSNV